MPQNPTRRTRWKRAAAFLAATLMAGLVLAGCSGSTNSTNQSAGKNGKAVRYTCPMHPDVLQDKPGACPKCGMKLVEKR